MAMRRVAGEAVRLIAAAIVGAALAQRSGAAPLASASAAAPANEVLEAAKGEFREAEHVFAYQVLAEAAKRSLDGDALLVGLFAAQAAILAVYVDQARSSAPFAAGVVRPMDWALIVAATGLLLTLGTREGPDAGYFAQTFFQDPWTARSMVMKRFEKIARRNETLRVLKVVCLIGSLGVTLWDVLTATGFARL